MESQQGGGGGDDKKIAGTPHKCFRTNGFKFAVLALTKISSNLTLPIQMDNKVALSCLFNTQYTQYTQSRAFKNQKINLTLSAVSLDHNYCRIFTKQFKCPSRPGGSECQGFLRLETASKHVLEHHQTFWISSSGHLNIQAVSSKYTAWELNSNSLATDAMQQCCKNV